MPCVLGCGKCCEVISLPSMPPGMANEIRENIERAGNIRLAYVANDGSELSDKMVVNYEHLAFRFHEISAEEAVRRNPLLAKSERENGAFFTCDWFDPETRLCKHHNERPPVCRDYPLYGRPKLEPDTEISWYAENCGYRRDIGKTSAEIAESEPTEADVRSYLATLSAVDPTARIGRGDGIMAYQTPVTGEAKP